MVLVGVVGFVAWEKILGCTGSIVLLRGKYEIWEGIMGCVFDVGAWECNMGCVGSA